MSDSFVRLVRLGRVKHPFQIGFSIEKWTEAYRELNAPSKADERLRATGIWFEERLRPLRDFTSTLRPPPNVSQDRRLRRAIGAVNRETSVALSITQYAAGTHTTADIIQKTVLLRGGAPTRPVYVVESSVDALRLELYRLAQLETRDSESSDYNDFEVVAYAINASALYHSLDQLWIDALWFGWYVETDEHGVAIFQCSDQLEEEHKVVAQYRAQQLVIEHGERVAQAWDELPTGVKELELARSRITDVSRVGKRLRLSVGPANSSEVRLEAIVRAIASEPYLHSLMNEPLPKWNGLTCNKLLNAWMVLAPMAALLERRFRHPDILDRGNQYEQFAPAISRNEVLRCLQRSLGLTIDEASERLDKLVWKGRAKDSLWSAPFVVVSDKALAVVLCALETPNLVRTVEYWMTEGGIDLAERGDKFNEYILAQATGWTSDSTNKLASRGSLPSALDLSSIGVGDLDLVLWIDNAILVCEVKCQKYPGTAFEEYQYRERLYEAAEQLDVRRSALASQKDVLVNRIRSHGFAGNEPELCYCIVVNTPVGTLRKIREYPVVDEYILAKYFQDGFAEMFGYIGRDGRPDRYQKRIAFYSNGYEAARNLGQYLAEPPHLSHLQNSVSWKKVALPGLKGQPPAAIMSAEVSLSIEKLAERHGIVVEDASTS